MARAFNILFHTIGRGNNETKTVTAPSRKTIATVFYKANEIEASESCEAAVSVWSYSEMDQSKNAQFLVHLIFNITARPYLLFT